VEELIISKQTQNIQVLPSGQNHRESSL